MFFELCFDQRQREARTDDGHVLPDAKQIGNRSDVVFVSVGEHNGQHIVHPMFNRLKIREDEVDAWLCFFRKQHAGVDNQQLAVELKDRHVAADFANSPEGNNAEGSGMEGWGVR